MIEAIKTAAVKFTENLETTRLQKRNKRIVKAIVITLMNPAIVTIKDSYGNYIFPKICRFGNTLPSSDQKMLLRHFVSVPEYESTEMPIEKSIPLKEFIETIEEFSGNDKLFKFESLDTKSEKYNTNSLNNQIETTNLGINQNITVNKKKSFTPENQKDNKKVRLTEKPSSENCKSNLLNNNDISALGISSNEHEGNGYNSYDTDTRIDGKSLSSLTLNNSTNKLSILKSTNETQNTKKILEPTRSIGDIKNISSGISNQKQIKDSHSTYNIASQNGKKNENEVIRGKNAHRDTSDSFISILGKSAIENDSNFRIRENTENKREKSIFQIHENGQTIEIVDNSDGDSDDDLYDSDESIYSTGERKKHGSDSDSVSESQMNYDIDTDQDNDSLSYFSSESDMETLPIKNSYTEEMMELSEFFGVNSLELMTSEEIQTKNLNSIVNEIVNKNKNIIDRIKIAKKANKVSRGLSYFEGLRERDKIRSTQFMFIVTTFQQFITLHAKEVLAELYKTKPNPTKTEISIALKTPTMVQTIQFFGLFYRYNIKRDFVSTCVFYNDVINEYIDIKDDFHQYKIVEGFSFSNYAFILNPLTKNEIIKLENSMTMRTELQDSFFHAMFAGVTCPYLVLEIRRDWLVRDTMCQLQLKTPSDLRKQLKVRFVGEEGIDEGGVQKEFFQLLVREMFDEKYGMFYANQDSNACWLVAEPEADELYLQEIKLMGMVLGLAIYNGVILNIHFPLALYKKLLGIPVYLNDLKQLDPDLYTSLIKILHVYTKEEIELTDQTFEITIKQIGRTQQAQLLPDGNQYKLEDHNKIEFVNSYVDYIFNLSCDKQFELFREGFLDIVGNTFVMNLCPNELELIICGSSDLDFDVLDKATVYDGGYSRETPVIEYFWEVVKEFSTEFKKKLLFFTTGSDRVPIGGLSRMRFVIVKNGIDSHRLPTSHTCFNALLLPEYNSKAKLKELLITAINNAEGFGMM
ncbi:hypothetical protein BB558_006670 [Smittium angustum]|uniref:HECT-type E3 ubiquitin transferase n=1 Tax=Smittium angustum TaxID=133377 RepID=A0A2U1IX26_SMIAN|nr:hypothetical protein BB558_006670 [Smittium angustum]